MPNRYFAAHDDALANGSFRVIRSTSIERKPTSYIATYINGDYMANDQEIARRDIDDHAAKLAQSGLREYDRVDFNRLAPAVCGGQRRLRSAARKR